MDVCHDLMRKDSLCPSLHSHGILCSVKNLDHEDWQTDTHLKDVADSFPNVGGSAEDKDSASQEYDSCA